MNPLEGLFILVVGAYGWIFKSMNDKIKCLEASKEKVAKLEQEMKEVKEDIKSLSHRQDKLEPILSELRSTMGEVKEAISWIKNMRIFNNRK